MYFSSFNRFTFTRNKSIFLWISVMWWSAKNVWGIFFCLIFFELFFVIFQVNRARILFLIFLAFACRNSYLMLAIQDDINNVALFVALHFLYLVLSRARVFFLSCFSSLEASSVSFIFFHFAKPFNLSPTENPFVFLLPFSDWTQKGDPRKKHSSSQRALDL